MYFRRDGQLGYTETSKGDNFGAPRLAALGLHLDDDVYCHEDGVGDEKDECPPPVDEEAVEWHSHRCGGEDEEETGPAHPQRGRKVEGNWRMRRGRDDRVRTRATDAEEKVEHGPAKARCVRHVGGKLGNGDVGDQVGEAVTHGKDWALVSTDELWAITHLSDQ